MFREDQTRLMMLGASGRLGRLLQAAWQGHDITLRCQSRRARPLPDWQCFDPLHAPGRFAQALVGADAVINLAGPVPRGGPVDLSLHTRLALATLRAAQQAGVPQVFLVSSAAVYGPTQGPVDEAAALAPQGPYGHAKVQMEQAVCDYVASASNAPKTTILRIGNVVGADQLLGAAPSGPLLLDRFPNGQSPRRSYIGPACLARVITRLVRLSQTRDLPPVLNVAAPGMVEMADLLRAAGFKWDDRPAPEGAIADVHLDTQVLQRFIRFPPASQTAAGMVAEWRTAAQVAVERAC